MDHHLFFSKAHIELKERVREFAETEVQSVARELDEKAEFSVLLTKRLGDVGLLGINLPEEYGGQGLDTLSYIIAVEELARIDSSQAATVAAHNSLGLAPIFNHGTKRQKEKYLPQLTNGEKLWAFGLTEPNAGSDIKGITTTAESKGNKWVVNGKKIFITNSSSSIAAGVTAEVITGKKENGKKEISTILIERNTPGYETEKISDKMIWRAADTGKILFSNCIVPKENLLGDPGCGARIMLHTLDGGRLSIGAIGLGLAQGAFEMALKYANERKQFGQPVGKYQSIAFKLSEMQMKIELARNTLYKVCMQKDKGIPYTKEAAIAKLYCSEIAREVADEAVQIHGANGLFKNFDIERFYRDQRILQIGEGTSEILKLVISRHLEL